MLYIELVARDETGTIVETKGNWMQTGNVPDWHVMSMVIRDEITPADMLEDEPYADWEIRAMNSEPSHGYHDRG